MMGFMKAVLGAFVFFALAGAIGVAGIGWWAHTQFNKVGPLEKPVLITIPRGAHIGGIADMLKHKNVIESYAVFKNMAKVTGRAENVKAGEYEFLPHMSMKEVLDQLEEGKVFLRQITVREGLTSHEVITLLNAHDGIMGERTKLLPPEGALLPETYSYNRNDDVSDIITRMKNAMTKTLDEAWENRVDGLPIKTKGEALTLASIIEKETAVPSERRRVAGVFINRLRKGMLLQTDPTVIYAITKGAHKNDGAGPLGRRLLTKDLKFDSPYNTYLYAGLPPGPIANPGKASIEAALNPEEHKYLYFVADGSGGHAFGKSLAEHNANVAKWRKIRAAQ